MAELDSSAVSAALRKPDADAALMRVLAAEEEKTQSAAN
jgi:hypothetical protein